MINVFVVSDVAKRDRCFCVSSYVDRVLCLIGNPCPVRSSLVIHVFVLVYEDLPCVAAKQAMRISCIVDIRCTQTP